MYSYPSAERPLETIASAGRRSTWFCYKLIAAWRCKKNFYQWGILITCLLDQFLIDVPIKVVIVVPSAQTIISQIRNPEFKATLLIVNTAQQFIHKRLHKCTIIYPMAGVRPSPLSSMLLRLISFTSPPVLLSRIPSILIGTNKLKIRITVTKWIEVAFMASSSPTKETNV